MASYPNAVSLQPSLPIRSGHQIHNQQNGGSARVHNGDVINNYTGTFGIYSSTGAIEEKAC
jgi:hypothetical protein